MTGYDPDWLTAVLSGDSEAFTPIVLSATPRLYALAMRLCSNRAEAEDLVQETFLDGYRKLNLLREPDKVDAWLATILRNKYLNSQMRSIAAVPMDEVGIPIDRCTPENRYVARESLETWRRRLSTLSPALRDTAILYFWRRMSMETIAARMHIPLGTVKRRIHDIREILKKEKTMEENKMKPIPDGFAEKVAEKVQELAEYSTRFGSMTGFDAAYAHIKALIADISDRDTAHKYAKESAAIAYAADSTKYAEDSLAVSRQTGDVDTLRDVYLDLCWQLGGEAEKAKYTRETILPALEAFPDSAAKKRALGYHNFWLAKYTADADGPTYDNTEKYLREAARLYKEAEAEEHCIDAMNGCVKSMLDALPLMRDSQYQGRISVTTTGERWRITNDGLYYQNQPGCSPVWYSPVYNYLMPVFYYAGCTGDRYFLPRDPHLAVGETETMRDPFPSTENAEDAGTRTIVSDDEELDVPAGHFTHCLHIHKHESDEITADVWYARGVGIVRIDACGHTQVLESYHIAEKTDDYLPTSVGTRWRYVFPDKPDVLCQYAAYEILEKDAQWVGLSCLEVAALPEDWYDVTENDMLLLCSIQDRLTRGEYDEALAAVEKVIRHNRASETVAYAMGIREHLREIIPYKKKNWRFCPGSINGSYITKTGGKLVYSAKANSKLIYSESELSSIDTGAWGTRGEENRIFGVKPFRFLSMIFGTLWDDRWVPGYAVEEPYSDYLSEPFVRRVRVEAVPEITVAAGTFRDCRRLIVDLDSADGTKGDYSYYFYKHTQCGHKEWVFAPGVGVVQFVCDWGGTEHSVCELRSYDTVAEDGEYMPVYIGNRWIYDEMLLTAENYIASREYRVMTGIHDRYFLMDNQLFTFKGDPAAYDAFKESLKK